MHRSSTAQSPVRPNQVHPRSVMETSPLHPVLQHALASLDSQLEDELLRYRRQRALGRAGYAPRSVMPRQVKAALNSMPVLPATEPLPSASASTSFHPTAAVPPLAAIATIPETSAIDPAALELKELAKQYASQVAEASDVTGAGSPDDYLESSEELLRTLSQEQAQVEAEQNFMQSLLTPLGLGSMLLLLMTSALFGFVLMNPNSVSQLLNRATSVATQSQSSPDPAAIDSTTVSPQPNLATQEFPELTLGHLGTIPADPHGLTPSQLPQSNPTLKPGAKTANLGASGVAGGTSTPQVPSVPSVPQVNPSATGAVSPAGDVPSPRKLSPVPREEPPTRAYTPPVRAYTPPTRSSSPPLPRPYTPPARSVNPAPVRPYTPPAKAVLPAPKPVPVPVPNASDRTPPPPTPAPTASTTPNPSGYKVVTPYTSDKVLEEYRGKVPDAYVKNYSDGAKVQFGAYQDETAAQSQAEDLRKQGIPAEVYKP